MTDQLMSRRRVVALAAGAGAAAVLAASVTGDAEAEGPQVAPELLGSWRATVTAVNPPLGSFRSLMTFTAGGGFLESRRPYVPVTPFGPVLETAGHGRWERRGSHVYLVEFVFLLQGAPDNPQHAAEPLGTDNVRWEPTLNRQTGVLSGPFQSEAKDESGAVVFVVQGVLEAERF